MKQLKWIVPMMALALALGGCPYSSEVPIDQPSVKIDEKLLGKWEPKSGSESMYTVSKQDAYNYKIEKKSTSSTEVTEYRAYLSNIGGETFLNLIETAEGSKSYYFYKVVATGSGSKVTLLPVTENIDEKFESSAELKAYFDKYKNLSFFFGKDEDVYIKAD